MNSIGLPVKCWELKGRDAVEDDENESVFVLGQQTVCGHAQLQRAPVATQVTATEHTDCPPAFVDALGDVVHDSITHLLWRYIKMFKMFF